MKAKSLDNQKVLGSKTQNRWQFLLPPNSLETDTPPSSYYPTPNSNRHSQKICQPSLQSRQASKAGRLSSDLRPPSSLQLQSPGLIPSSVSFLPQIQSPGLILNSVPDYLSWALLALCPHSQGTKLMLGEHSASLRPVDLFNPASQSISFPSVSS